MAPVSYQLARRRDFLELTSTVNAAAFRPSIYDKMPCFAQEEAIPPDESVDVSFASREYEQDKAILE